MTRTSWLFYYSSVAYSQKQNNAFQWVCIKDKSNVSSLSNISLFAVFCNTTIRIKVEKFTRRYKYSSIGGDTMTITTNTLFLKYLAVLTRQGCRASGDRET